MTLFPATTQSKASKQSMSDQDLFDTFLVACKRGNVDRVRIKFLECPQLLTTKFDGDRYLLHEAIAIGNMDICRAMLEHGKEMKQDIVTLVDHLNRVPLEVVINHDRAEIVRIMHELGYDIQICKQKESSAVAASKGSLNTVQYLLTSLFSAKKVTDRPTVQIAFEALPLIFSS